VEERAWVFRVLIPCSAVPLPFIPSRQGRGNDLWERHEGSMGSDLSGKSQLSDRLDRELRALSNSGEEGGLV